MTHLPLYKELATLLTAFTSTNIIASHLNDLRLFNLCGSIHTKDSVNAVLASLRKPEQYPNATTKEFNSLVAQGLLTESEIFALTHTYAQIRTNNFLKGNN